MDNLVKFALTAKFGKDLDLNAVVEVLEATRNVAVATEKLLGIYEAPVIPEFSEKIRYQDKGKYTLISFDPFTENVEYSYLRKKTDFFYYSADKYPTGLAKADYSKEPENFFHTKNEAIEAGLDNITGGHVYLGVSVEAIGNCSLDDWENGKKGRR
jgi:hypothetical protein